LNSKRLDEVSHLQTAQLEVMSHVENFPIHLMRQILAERSLYPYPDLAPQIRASFTSISDSWARGLLASIEPFLLISQQYESIVQECKDLTPIAANEYYDRLMAIFSTLSFDGVEEAVWNYLAFTR
jgi:hypothetical protein